MSINNPPSLLPIFCSSVLACIPSHIILFKVHDLCFLFRYSDVKMGAGRKTQTFILPPNADLAPYPVQARQLRSNHLGGVIFWCKSSTMMEILVLAAGHGQMNIDPYGWTTDGSVRTQFPAQVQIRIRLQCKPLLESQFKPIIADNYYSANKFWFEIDHAETNKLMSLLASCAVVQSLQLVQEVEELKAFKNEQTKKIGYLEYKPVLDTVFLLNFLCIRLIMLFPLFIHVK
ncbi:putative development/cell death domain-containing protein [Rosa chinensis]|uniref:Putative development/cell death domain-containing protein n=1 Tax=Rosa chinensis TaxID=74649 RepID=A0A2P6RYK6_ROSCH|nr:putative development/cell death domain-containing protein [Rosa chinensis]